MKLSPVFLSLFAAGILSAQTAPASHARPAGNRMQRLAADLNLTPDQQAQARAIFQSSRQQTQTLMPQLRQQRQAMSAAVKSGNEAQIDQIVQQNSQLDSQMHAIHAKAQAKFYALLTPDQKTAYDQRMKARFARPHTQKQQGE